MKLKLKYIKYLFSKATKFFSQTQHSSSLSLAFSIKIVGFRFSSITEGYNSITFLIVVNHLSLSCELFATTFVHTFPSEIIKQFSSLSSL